jgi:hypothetical protein
VQPTNYRPQRRRSPTPPTTGVARLARIDESLSGLVRFLGETGQVGAGAAAENIRRNLRQAIDELAA